MTSLSQELAGHITKAGMRGTRAAPTFFKPQEITDHFLLLGYSSNIFQYFVLDSLGNGLQENTLKFKAL